MAVRTVFTDEEKLFYITFTCTEWLPLIKLADSYDVIYNWFKRLNTTYNIQVASYVIMPNHIHCIFSFPEKGVSLNTAMREGKIYLAREILKRLKQAGEKEVLEQMKSGVTPSRHAKGQQYVIFRPGFEAKAIVSKKFLFQKIKYIHMNPVRGNYNLVEDWRDYPHSSAGFYEFGQPGYFDPTHYNELK
jgi:REP element-mobilizing transposase RayT